MSIQKRIVAGLCLALALPSVASISKTPIIESVPGEYIVRFKDARYAELQTKVLSQHLHAYVKSTIPSLGIAVIKRPIFETMASVQNTYGNSEQIDVIEPNYIYRINKSPNDPAFGLQWGMMNVGQADPEKKSGVSGVDIGMDRAWDLTTGNKNVIVGVIDTGVNYRAPDLAPNMWVNEAEARGKQGVDDDGNGYVDDIYGWNFAANKADPMDDHGHGSHCAGVIGARGDDGKGVAGVNWNVRIMALKFLSADGSGSLETALQAIDYATKMGATLTSNSWGGGGYSQTLKDAIDRANKAGKLFIAAAGNDSRNNDDTPSYPASYDLPNIISVAAIDNRGKLAYFSNVGKKSVHLAAPGVNIYSVSMAKGGFESMSGTSMATPHVAGVAALLAGYDSRLNYLQIRDRLLRTVKKLPALKNQVATNGMVNAYAALTNQEEGPDLKDPANWRQVSYAYSSAHPYANSTKFEFEVRVPGARRFALFFSKFQTERGFDYLRFFNKDGVEIDAISGNYDQSYSPVFEGDYVRAVFTSDASESKYGFDISQIAVE